MAPTRNFSGRAAASLLCRHREQPALSTAGRETPVSLHSQAFNHHTTNPHHGEEENQEENPCCGKPQCQKRGPCLSREDRQERPKEHGHPDRCRRGRLEHQPIGHRCAQGDGAWHGKPPEGEKGQQIARLRYDVRPLGSHASAALLEVLFRKYEPACVHHAPRPNTELPSREILVGKRCETGSKTPLGWREGVHHSALGALHLSSLVMWKLANAFIARHELIDE